MRRMYVVPIDTWEKHTNIFHPRIGSYGIHLINYASEADALLMNTDHDAWLRLHAVQEWMDNGSQIVLSTSFDHSEYAEDVWHGHDKVAILPNPMSEGNDKLITHKDSPKKKLKQVHLDHLRFVDVVSTDTVWDVSDKTKLRNSQCCLRAII